ncbi:MAG: hypothetical protein ACI376_03565 [Candidatus Bruticola sp.]
MSINKLLYKIGKASICTAFIGIAYVLLKWVIDGRKFMDMLDVVIYITLFLFIFCIGSWFKKIDRCHRISVGEIAYKLDMLDEIKSYSCNKAMMNFSIYGIATFLFSIGNFFRLFLPSTASYEVISIICLSSCSLGVSGILLMTYGYKNSLYDNIMKENDKETPTPLGSGIDDAVDYIYDEQYDRPQGNRAPHKIS